MRLLIAAGSAVNSRAYRIVAINEYCAGNERRHRRAPLSCIA
jgi:hypothetical protein